jgi:hypothetical protein
MRAPPLRPNQNVPNVLTFLRVAAVPALAALWFAPVRCAAAACAVLFVAASFTDWLDGYIARRYEIVTAFGAFLDPVADKIMVTTALVLLTLSPPAPLGPAAVVLPVVLIINRWGPPARSPAWFRPSRPGLEACLQAAAGQRPCPVQTPLAPVRPQAGPRARPSPVRPQAGPPLCKRPRARP